MAPQAVAHVSHLGLSTSLLIRANMGFGRGSRPRKTVRGLMPTGQEAPSLHGVGRARLPPAMTSSQISQLNIKVLQEVKDAGQSRRVSLPDTHDDLFDDAPDSPLAQGFLDVLEGGSLLDISHGGGEFEALRDESTTTKAQR